MRRKKVVLACLLTTGLVAPGVASAGLLSDLSGFFQDAVQMVSNIAGNAVTGQGIFGILETGKAVNTGQVQQMQASEQERNQKLQEQTQAEKELLKSKFVYQYLNDTGSFAQPLGCNSIQMGSANLQSVQAQEMQQDGGTYGAANGFVAGNAVVDEPSQVPSGISQIDALARYTGNQSNADALFNATSSSHQATVEQELLAPFTPESLTKAQGETPAGKLYQAQWNIDAGALSVASAGLGVVASMHTFVVPGSAIQNAATAQGISAQTAAASVARPAPSVFGKVANPQPAASSSGATSGSSGGRPDWAGITPIYWQQIARAAAAENVPPAMMAAQVGNEDGSENLKALALAGSIDASGVVYQNFHGFQVACYPTTYQGQPVCDSAKSLFQMINTTAASYGLTNPMTGTVNAQAEANAAAVGYHTFYSQCNGNLACVWDAWAVGHAQAQVSPTWMGYVQKAYADYKEHGGTWTWTGQPAKISGYVGGTSLYDTGSGSGNNAGSWVGSSNGASEAGLLRMTSYGSYANPAWLQKLDTLPTAGVWKVVAYLQAMQNVVANNNRKLLEHYVAIVAERNALLLQQKEGQMNSLRAAAMQQYANEPVLEKLYNDL